MMRRLRPCAACPNRRRPRLIIPPSGPRSARILLVGERPSWQEARDLMPFVGDTGVELNRLYLPFAGIDRADTRVTNAVHCYAEGRNPADYEIDACVEQHLAREVEELPELELIVLMGAAACRTAGINIEMEHGRAVEVQDYLGAGPRVLFVVYHPSLGMRTPDIMTDIIDDFKALGAYLRGEYSAPKDEIPEPHYELIDDPDRFDFAEARRSPLPIAMDTETEEDGETMYCLSFSTLPGTGFMVERGNRPSIDAVNWMIKDREVWFHNWMFDASVAASGGLDLDPRQVVDTMTQPFHRQQSQGLKVQAYRRCGMRMREYADVVRPYGEAMMYEHIETAARRLEADAEQRAALLWLAQRTGMWSVAKATPLPLPRAVEIMTKKGLRMRCAPALWKKLRGVLRRWEKFEGSNILKGWEKLADEVKAEAERVAGKKPEVGIRAVPIEERIEYACRDADACLRVGMSYGLHERAARLAER